MKPTIALGVLLSSTIAIAMTTATTAQAQPPPASKENNEKSSEPDPKSKLLWLEAQGGVQSANLNTFNADFRNFSVGFLPRSGLGPMVDVGAGLRLVFVTFGLRGRVARFEESDARSSVRGWSMSSINGEVGLRVPLRRLEPYMTVAGGYTTFGGFAEAIDGVQQGLNVNGANLRMGLGVDYFIAQHISLGVLGTGELLMLTRPGIPAREVASLPASRGLDTAAVRALEANGSTYGTAIALTGGLKAHF